MSGSQQVIKGMSGAIPSSENIVHVLNEVCMSRPTKLVWIAIIAIVTLISQELFSRLWEWGTSKSPNRNDNRQHDDNENYHDEYQKPQKHQNNYSPRARTNTGDNDYYLIK